MNLPKTKQEIQKVRSFNQESLDNVIDPKGPWFFKFIQKHFGGIYITVEKGSKPFAVNGSEFSFWRANIVIPEIANYSLGLFLFEKDQAIEETNEFIEIQKILGKYNFISKSAFESVLQSMTPKEVSALRTEYFNTKK